jgi:hypothetical protein
MTEESQATVAVVAEPVSADAPQVTTETEGLTDGQAADSPEEPGEAEKKSRAAERRERHRAHIAQVKAERDAAVAKAAEADARRQKLLNAAQMDAEPTERDFPDPLELAAAKASWKMDQKRTDRFAQEAETEATEAKRQAAALTERERQVYLDAFDEQAKEAASRYADYDAVVKRKGMFPLGNALPDMIMTSDVAADLAYAVARDQALHDELIKLPPVEMARRLGRIEASLHAPKPRTETQAPTPIAPVRGSARAAPNADAMSYEEYRQARMSGKLR